MSRLQRAFPEGAAFYRESDEGELMVMYPCLTGYEHSHEQMVADWVDEYTIEGTTFNVVESGDGQVVSVVLSPPGGGVSAGAVAARRFRLVRHEDLSGVSGTGVVLHGVQWPDGTIAGRWAVPGLPASSVNWDRIEDVELLHGHQGKTEVEWID
jgi:hypothetical protein